MAAIRAMNSVCNKLYKNLKGMAPVYHAEAIHAFRVSYKQTRAALRLAEIKKSGPAKMPRGLKAIYRKTGEIRDLQLLLQKTETYCRSNGADLPQYYITIQQQLHQLIQQLPASLPGKAGRQLHRLQARMGMPVPFVNRCSFLAGGVLAVQHYAAKRHATSSQLHLIRKYLKDIYYNRMYVNITAKAAPELTMLMEQLGRYQDYCRALCLLNRYAHEAALEREKDVTDGMKAEWLEERQLLKTRISLHLQQLNLFALFPWLAHRLLLNTPAGAVIV